MRTVPLLMVCDMRSVSEDSAITYDLFVWDSREEYVWTTHPYRKSIVILVDHGNSLSSNQLYTAQAIARHMLNALNEHDRVSSMSFLQHWP